MPDGSSCLPTAGSLAPWRRGLLEAGEDFPLVGAQRGAVADQRRNRGAGSADGSVGTGTPHRRGLAGSAGGCRAGPASGSGGLGGGGVVDGADERLGGGGE